MILVSCMFVNLSDIFTGQPHILEVANFYCTMYIFCGLWYILIHEYGLLCSSPMTCWPIGLMFCSLSVPLQGTSFSQKYLTCNFIRVNGHFNGLFETLISIYIVLKIILPLASFVHKHAFICHFLNIFCIFLYAPAQRDIAVAMSVHNNLIEIFGWGFRYYYDYYRYVLNFHESFSCPGEIICLC